MTVCYVRKKAAMIKVVHCHLRCCLLSLLLMQMSHCAPDDSNFHRHDHTGAVQDAVNPNNLPEDSKMGISLAQSATRKEAELFLDHLFVKYGRKGVMTFEGFEHLLQSLGIGNVTIVDHDLKDHYTESGFVEFHEDHRHVLKIEDDHHDHSHDDHDHDHSHHDDNHHGSHHHGSNADDDNGNYDVGRNRSGYNQSGSLRHGHDSNGHRNHNHNHGNSDSNHNGHNHDSHDHDGDHGNHRVKQGHDHSSHGNRDRDDNHDHHDHNEHHKKDKFGHSHEVHHQDHYDHDHSLHHRSRPTTPSPNTDGSDDLFEWYDFFDFAEESPSTTPTPVADFNEEQYSGEAAAYYNDLVGFADDKNYGNSDDRDAAAYYNDLVGFAEDVGKNTRSASSTTNSHDYAPNDQGDGDSATLRSNDKKSHSNSPRRSNGRKNRKNRRRNNDDNNELGTTPSHWESDVDSSTTHQRARDISRSSRDLQSRQKRAAVSESSNYLAERKGLPQFFKKCLTAQEILSAYHIMIRKGITKEDFVNMCPAIVYQIDEHACTDDAIPIQCVGLQGYELRKCVTKYGHDHGEHGTAKKGMFDIKPKVWGYAILAVTIISLVGLLSVAIVPVMRKVFYNYLIQFLVAVAIGSLTGDALLHLIPHALGGGHSGEDHDHSDGGHGHSQDAIYKGLIVLFGIYFFFVMERFMDYWTQRRQRKRKLKMLKSDKFYIRADTSDTIGEKLSHHELQKRSVENIVVPKFPDEDIPKLLEDSEFHDGTKDELTFEGLSKDIEGHKGHGHSHGDGQVPDSIAAIAWMVIMGDGLHNFSDGLAIGAAFANSITGGLSTSIAVFCHELPHELGDFAVLLRAGMPVKQALFYNIVSSVLCVIGMIIGVLIGNINEASLWIFALTAGIFIYISMVDMLPEITNPPVLAQESRSIFFLAQFFGISTGIGIMLLIALFEEKIRLNFDDSEL